MQSWPRLWPVTGANLAGQTVTSTQTSTLHSRPYWCQWGKCQEHCSCSSCWCRDILQDLVLDPSWHWSQVFILDTRSWRQEPGRSGQWHGWRQVRHQRRVRGGGGGRDVVRNQSGRKQAAGQEKEEKKQELKFLFETLSQVSYFKCNL